MSRSSNDHPIRRILLIPAQVAVLVYLAIDAGLNFFVRPLWRWLGRMRLFTRLGEWIASLPAYIVLLVLAVPFAIAEPAKVFAVFLMTRGHFHMGLILMVGAYAMSLVVVDRIYQAGEARLRSIPWFAKVMNWLFALRDQVLDWGRQTAAWQMAQAMRERLVTAAKVAWRRLRGAPSRGRREA